MNQMQQYTNGMIMKDNNTLGDLDALSPPPPSNPEYDAACRINRKLRRKKIRRFIDKMFTVSMENKSKSKKKTRPTRDKPNRNEETGTPWPSRRNKKKSPTITSPSKNEIPCLLDITPTRKHHGNMNMDNVSQKAQKPTTTSGNIHTIPIPTISHSNSQEQDPPQCQARPTLGYQTKYEQQNQQQQKAKNDVRSSNITRSTRKMIGERLKVVVLGSSGVGKTSLIQQYHSNTFKGPQYKATIGADFVCKEITIPLENNIAQRDYLVQIWDTPGKERFQPRWTSLYRGVHVCVLVYDVTDRKSFEALDRLRNEFLQDIGHTPGNSTENDKRSFILLGNKADTGMNNDTFEGQEGRCVTRTEAEEWCASRGSEAGIIPYYETSAKTASNVEDAFTLIAKIALIRAEPDMNSDQILSATVPSQNIYYNLRGDQDQYGIDYGQDQDTQNRHNIYIDYQLEDNQNYDEEDGQDNFNDHGEDEMDQDSLNTEQTIQFVESIRSEFDKLSSQSSIRSHSIQTMGEDNLFFMAKKFIECKNNFEQRGICADVSLGFHYTQERNIQMIQRDGLMTRTERARDPSRLAFGDGVYVGNNFYAFQGKRYGPIGLFVAILKGTCATADYVKRLNFDRNDFDTIIGNKKEIASMNGSGFHDEIVLQRSCQCLPLLRFDSNDPDGMNKLATYTMSLQSSVEDFFSDDGRRDMNETVRMPIKETPYSDSEDLIGDMYETFEYGAPHSLAAETNEDKLFCTMTWDSNENFNYAECPICLEEMNKSDHNVVGLNIDGCNHCFHRHCIESCIQVTPRCPVCRKGIVEPRGQSPSGSLLVKASTEICLGFENQSTRSFVLTYSMRGGIQKCYHPNPGKQYRGTVRTAYIPDVSDGRRLLKRLVYAFERGLTFMIGTSMTTGMENAITWSSIHHKTNLYGGAQKHGYPDESYLMNCHEELDSLDVPYDPCSLNSSIINMM